MTDDAPLDTPRYGPLLIGFNAVVAWIAVALSFTLAVTGYYVGREPTTKPTLIGHVPSGMDTPLERLFDWLTYFTIWSNVTVAVVTTAIILRPCWFAGSSRRGRVWRALRLDSLLMIIVTGVVFNLLLSTGGKTGWDLLNNTLVHVVVPLLTPIVWIIVGPRGLIGLRTIPRALVLPLVWVAFALIRGQVIGAYPYPFLDVASNGWVSVLVFVAAIVVLAVLIALALMGIDKALVRASGRTTGVGAD